MYLILVSLDSMHNKNYMTMKISLITYGITLCFFAGEFCAKWTSEEDKEQDEIHFTSPQ